MISNVCVVENVCILSAKISELQLVFRYDSDPPTTTSSDSDYSGGSAASASEAGSGEGQEERKKEKQEKKQREKERKEKKSKSKTAVSRLTNWVLLETVLTEQTIQDFIRDECNITNEYLETISKLTC